jgi:hypothetical protein
MNENKIDFKVCSLHDYNATIDMQQQRIVELESTINMMHGQLKYHRELTRKLSVDLAEETGYAVLENYGECLAKNAELEQEVERLKAPKEELVTTARNAGKHAFIECDTCRAKPGSPTLCWGCLHNRQLISWQQGKIAELEGRLEAALHGVPAQAELDRLRQEVERLKAERGQLIYELNRLKGEDPAVAYAKATVENLGRVKPLKRSVAVIDGRPAIVEEKK